MSNPLIQVHSELSGELQKTAGTVNTIREQIAGRTVDTTGIDPNVAKSLQKSKEHGLKKVNRLHKDINTANKHANSHNATDHSNAHNVSNLTNNGKNGELGKKGTGSDGLMGGEKSGRGLSGYSGAAGKSNGSAFQPYQGSGAPGSAGGGMPSFTPPAGGMPMGGLGGGSGLGGLGGGRHMSSMRGPMGPRGLNRFQEKLLNIAGQTRGTPYSWGGGSLHGPTFGTNGPGDGWRDSEVNGFDCSAYTRFALYQASQLEIPRTSQEQF